jgi:hypothetical protein
MIPLWLALGGLGLAKGFMDKSKVRAQNMAAATQTQYSPWTKMGAGETKMAPSALGAAMQGGVTGLALNKYLGEDPLGGLADSVKSGASKVKDTLSVPFTEKASVGNTTLPYGVELDESGSPVDNLEEIPASKWSQMYDPRGWVRT